MSLPRDDHVHAYWRDYWKSEFKRGDILDWVMAHIGWIGFGVFVVLALALTH
jgi:hypothetical protein